MYVKKHVRSKSLIVKENVLVQGKQLSCDKQNVS